MNWYTFTLTALASLAGAAPHSFAQSVVTGAENPFPVSLSDLGYRTGINQAARPALTRPFFYFHHRNIYGIRGLAENSFAGGYPFSSGVMSLAFRSTGFGSYRDQMAGLSFARGFGKRISAGVQLDYLTAASSEADLRARAVTFEAGMIAEPVQNLLMGFHLFNPLGNRFFNANNQRLPSLANIALGYRPAKVIFLVAELEKELESLPVYKFMAAYHPDGKFTFQCGLHRFQGLIFGFYFCGKNLITSVDISRHPDLGCSFAGGIGWVMKSGKK